MFLVGFFELGHHTKAADLVNQTMTNPLSETNAAIHIAYSHFAMKVMQTLLPILFRLHCNCVIQYSMPK